MKEVNQIERAAKAWDVLTGVSQERGSITYGELAKKIGIHHRPLRHVLGIIQNHCQENNYPPLTILVVNQNGLRGTGFIGWDKDLKEDIETVYSEKWDDHSNPFSYGTLGISEATAIKTILERPDEIEDLYSKIKVRGVIQSLFRKALLKAYNNKCAICGFSFLEALQASHIKPWTISSVSERLDITNGVLLCANHHKLFDFGLFSIDDDYSIIYCDPNKEYGGYTTTDESFTIKYHNEKMLLPKDKKHWPNKDFLKVHRENLLD